MLFISAMAKDLSPLLSHFLVKGDWSHCLVSLPTAEENTCETIDISSNTRPLDV